MRVVIYGAGAIGATIGGRLFEAGHDVLLVARGQHYSALATRGLELRSPDRTVTLPVPVVDHPRSVRFGPDDVVLLTMKTQDTVAALETLAAVAPPDLPVISAQNGVANEPLALRHFPRVYGMCVMLPANHLSPGIVRAGAAPVTGILDVGRYPLGVDPLAHQVAAALSASTFHSRAEPRIMRRKYTKLLMNLGNALDAACGALDRTGDLYRMAKEEGVACFHAAGIDYSSDEEDRERRKGMSPMRYPDGERHGSSTWQSLERRAGTTEADYLNGEVVLLGRLHGVPTQVNAVLQRVAARMAREGMAPGSFRESDLLASVEASVASESGSGSAGPGPVSVF
jgi:2-dehydropantoate 2-reductase